MRVPSTHWMKHYLRAFGLVIIGALMGGAWFMAIYHHNFGLLFTDNQKLKNENEELKKTLEPYLRSKDRASAIKSIKLHVTIAPGAAELDEVAAIRFKRLLARDFEALRGRPVDGAADLLLALQAVIERKIYAPEPDREYTVRMSLMSIKSAELTLWIEARPYIRDQS